MRDERESLFSALQERLDAVGPPWGNPELRAREVEEGFEAAYEILDRAKRLEALIEKAEAFGEMVLECDRYGCENGPDKCLHADAARFLGELRDV